MFRILTLNVNGIRSAGTKGLFRWLPKADADVVCLQEVKAHEADIPEAWRFPDDLHGHFHCAQKKGYSGTALYSKVGRNRRHHRGADCGEGFMTTKYAKAKDTAFQWRAEYRKVKAENRSLRRVLSAAQEFITDCDRITSGDLNVPPERIELRRQRLKAEVRAVVLAIGGE